MHGQRRARAADLDKGVAADRRGGAPQDLAVGQEVRKRRLAAACTELASCRVKTPSCGPNTQLRFWHEAAASAPEFPTIRMRMEPSRSGLTLVLAKLEKRLFMPRHPPCVGCWSSTMLGSPASVLCRGGVRAAALQRLHSRCKRRCLGGSARCVLQLEAKKQSLHCRVCRAVGSQIRPTSWSPTPS